MYRFPTEITWHNIIGDITSYIDLGWQVNAKQLGILIPWSENKYSAEQLYEPIEVLKKIKISDGTTKGP